MSQFFRWPKYWSFSFSISTSNEHPGLISFTMDWFVLLAVQGTQESSPTPQLEGINFSVLSFFILQLSHPCMTTGKTIALTRWISSVQFSSVAQSCPTLCNPMNRSMPGLPVQHQLLEFTETHIHRVSDAIQPSHPLSSPSPPAPNPSQHQSLFQ